MSGFSQKPMGAAALAGGLVLALVCTVAPRADSASPMSAGRWHRRTMMEVPKALKNQPDVAAMAGRIFESDLCIGPNRAARGAVAVALADDGSECRVLSSQFDHDRFTARRECRTSTGKQVSTLSGKFTATTLAFSSTAQINGVTLTAVSAYAFTGACQSTDIAAP